MWFDYRLSKFTSNCHWGPSLGVKLKTDKSEKQIKCTSQPWAQIYNRVSSKTHPVLEIFVNRGLKKAWLWNKDSFKTEPQSVIESARLSAMEQQHRTQSKISILNPLLLLQTIPTFTKLNKKISKLKYNPNKLIWLNQAQAIDCSS